MTLRHRVWVSATVVFVLMALITLAGYELRVVRNRERADLVQRLLPAEVTVENLSTGYIDQETGVTGFVLTRRRDFRDPDVYGSAYVDQDVARLRHLLAAYPRLLGQLDRVQAAAAVWRRQAADPELAAADSGGPVDLALVDQGNVMFNTLRDELVVLRMGVSTQATSTASAFVRSARLLDDTAMAGVALVLAALLMALVLERRWVTRPLARLRRSLQAVAGGALNVSIPPFGPPEVAAVAGDAERMRVRIVEELRESVRAYEALEQQAPVVWALRERLAPTPGLLPPGLDVAVATLPAQGVLSGDWHDTIDMGGTRRIVAVVDVSGHGPVAGLLALEIKAQLSGALALQLPPGEALTWLSRRLGDTGELFATIAVVDIDAATGRCTYAGAGHPPLLLIGPRGMARLSSTGPLVGPFPAGWDSEDFQLAKGESVVVYTDGVTEARNADGEEFGVDRLGAAAVRHHRQPASAIVQACVDATNQFAGERLFDDGTVVVAKRL
jgi:sigma-B regulation protein RsbU (phosphoserine phosphatase)